MEVPVLVALVAVEEALAGVKRVLLLAVRVLRARTAVPVQAFIPMRTNGGSVEAAGVAA
jgi:hypothetical protein